MDSNQKIKPEPADRENVRPDQPAQPADTPTDDSYRRLNPDMPLHTPFNSPGMHRLAQNRPAPARPDMEIEEMERLTRSLAAERRRYYERKSAAEAKSALEYADAPVNAPVNTPVPALTEGSQSLEPRKEKDILHL
ncbi:hypothetical protein FPQ18DRAFT_387201 [Pyronema domesticum]|nr:hypothetical protein FPQ18DRAFT_387201 [Pyronema domesticum]